MSIRARHHLHDLRDATRLAVEATTQVTNVVEAMHRTIGGGPALLGRPLEPLVRILSAPTYGTIRLTTKLVGAAVDLAVAQLAPLLAPGVPRWERDLVVSALNGVVGDHLAATGNPLAIEMHLRHEGRPLELEAAALASAFPAPGTRLLVLVHGSAASDRWLRRGHDHGAALARDLGYTPLVVRYNSGRHVSTNGRDLAALLDRLVAAWPGPVDELVLLGHSMGGLVSRSACHYAERAPHAWRAKLRAMVFLGTPHHGAPLERGGNRLEVLLGLHRYSAPLATLGRLRSAGITDLRFGNVVDEHWEGRDRFEPGRDRRTPVPLPQDVACYAIAATVARAPGPRLPGDGLVPHASALGRHARPELCLAIPEANQWTGFGMGHLDLLDRPEVHDRLKAWLAPSPRGPAPVADGRAGYPTDRT